METQTQKKEHTQSHFASVEGWGGEKKIASAKCQTEIRGTLCEKQFNSLGYLLNVSLSGIKRSASAAARRSALHTRVAAAPAFALELISVISPA